MHESGVSEEEVEQLWRWGEALLDDPRPEVRAAGKAIVILAAEVDRLERQLWHEELGIAPVEAAPDASEPAPHEGEQSVQADLLTAARRVLRPWRRARQPMSNDLESG